MNYPHADFVPTLAGYSGQEPFRYWCQLALPLTYDDSLSYYELLNKIVAYLNNTISDVANVESNVDALADAFASLQNYVNEWFDNLDLIPEIKTALDEMATDGTLFQLLTPLVGYYTPEMFGFVSGDATTYVNRCLEEIETNPYGIKTIKFTSGVYILNNIRLLNDNYTIIIDPDATLMPSSGASYLFDISKNSSLKLMGGGKIDNAYTSTYCVIGYLNHNYELVVDNIEFARIKRYGFYINELGGNFVVRNCYVHDMAYQTETTHSAHFVHIASGEANYQGHFEFTYNRLIETSYNENDYVHGPGGIFMCDVVDADRSLWGNNSTAVISHNIFDGLGSAVEPVYSIHIYYQWDGIVIDSNIFKNYYEGAIAVKDSNNVTISNNVFEDAQIGITQGRTNYAGAINYQPSDHTPGTEHYGLTITSNVFKKAPRTDENTYTNFITIWGRSANNVVMEYANDIIITSNKFETANRCIYASGMNNLIFNDNRCKTNYVMSLYYCKGDLIFANNAVETTNGSVIVTNTNSAGLKLNVHGNNIIDKSNDGTAHRLFYVRSVDSCVFESNYIFTNQAQTIPAAFTRFDANSQNNKRIAISGNILEGSTIVFTYQWDYIDAIEGDIFSSGTPVSTVKSSGGGRCRYYDTSANKYYVSQSTTAWLELTTS